MIKKIEKDKLKGQLLWPSKFMGKYTQSMKGYEEQFINEAQNYMVNLAKELKNKTKNTNNDDTTK